MTHLKHFLHQYVSDSAEKYTTRTGIVHQVADYGGLNGDGRRTIPSTIRCALVNLADPKATWGTSEDQKAPLTWIVCYIHNILPDTTREDWQSYDCSHRCICHNLIRKDENKRYVCVEPGCLVWESKSYNQSRGNWYCCKKCAHNDCQKSVCECNKIHEPACL